MIFWVQMEPCVICHALTSLYYRGQPVCIDCDLKREQGREHGKERNDEFVPKKPPAPHTGAGESGAKLAYSSHSM